MKRIIFLAVLALGMFAYASDYMAATFSQVGAGTNGMTSAAPALATDGIAVQSKLNTVSTDGRCSALLAIVTVEASSGNKFVTSATQGYERGWVYLPNPDGGAAAWSAMPSMDIAIDAGTLGGQGGASSISIPVVLSSLQSGRVVALQGAGARVMWQAENISQSNTLDAGTFLGIQLFAPSSCP
jgi:hypothetical protein